MMGLLRCGGLVCAILLVACGGPSDQELNPEEYDENGDWIYSKESTYFDDMAEDRGFDSYEEMEEYDAEFGGESYDEFDERRDSYDGSRGNFVGYGCTVDCSGHEAGYAWAEENGIEDPDNCGGRSWSFIEGCRAYAEENGY